MMNGKCPWWVSGGFFTAASPAVCYHFLSSEESHFKLPSLERRWLRDWFSLGWVTKYFGRNTHSSRRKTTTWWSMSATRKRDKKCVHEAKLMKKQIGWINRTDDIVLTFVESTGRQDIVFVFKAEALPRPSWMWFSVAFPADGAFAQTFRAGPSVLLLLEGPLPR